jgi:hypothetical protein
VIGSVTSFSQFAAVKTTRKVICPDGSTHQSHSYESTTTDEFGNSEPATGVELRCVDQIGSIVKTDPVGYAFLWDGIFAIIGLVISAILALLLAAPLGILFGKLLNRGQKPNIVSNIELQ